MHLFQPPDDAAVPSVPSVVDRVVGHHGSQLSGRELEREEEVHCREEGNRERRKRKWKWNGKREQS